MRLHHLIAALACMGLLLTGCRAQSRGDDIPLPGASHRPTPLHFGLYVTPDPAHNPIDPPERFTGYHTALDIEILPGEEEAAVPVRALCNGTVRFSGSAEGYGGTVVHDCALNNEPVTVLYGHLLVSSLLPDGSPVRRGTQLGILAPAYSSDSGDTRKHLHLSIHRGEEVDFRGYVEEEAELEEWVDPGEVLGLP